MKQKFLSHPQRGHKNPATRSVLCWIGSVALLTLSVVHLGGAQVRDRERDLDEDRPTRQQSSTMSLITVPPLEGSIDPAHYVVGPSDVFSINIWTNPPLAFMLQVSPEGTVIIPSVGDVAVDGLTLAEAKNTVLERIRKKYLIGEPTMTLVRPRSILVRIEGAVIAPGQYVQYATDRVDAAIRQANGGRLPSVGKEGLLAPHISTRHILLHRRDGTVHRVDIPLYQATRDGTLNPFLREGDVIIVPELKQEGGAIGIYGGVNVPGRFEYVEGDSLSTILQMAFGLGYRAEPDSILLTRLDSSGTRMSEYRISFKDLEDGTAQNIAIRPGDRVFVKERTDLRADYRVWVTGEVRDPGRYPITRNRTRLSEVIAMAGGLTPHASLPSSQVFRTSARPADLQQNYLLSYRGLVSPEDSVNYLVEAALKLRREMVTVDFKKVLLSRDSSFDVVLQSEDSIFVAPALHTVYVFGQVLKPGHIPLRPGEDADYYVKEAGGLTEHAKGGDIMIIKRSTGQALEEGEGVIEDGDYVWVPLSPDRPFGYHLGIAAQAAAIVTAAATIIILITTSK